MPLGDFMLLEDLFLLVMLGCVGGGAIAAGIITFCLGNEVIKNGGTFPGIRSTPWICIVAGAIVLGVGIVRAITTCIIIKGMLV